MAQMTTDHACFLCALDAHPCAVPQVEGHILRAYEGNANGDILPFVTLDTGTVLVSLLLTKYYHNLVKGLKAVGDAMKTLKLRVYHLPQAPTIEEYRGRPLHRYSANTYTLAVLEPDSVLNITDLNQAAYCARQYLLNQLVPSPASAATIRGNLVHSCFKELLKEHDRGELMHGYAQQAHETPLEMLQRHLQAALNNSSIDLAVANISGEALRSDVAPHLDSLATWFQNQRATLWDMPAEYEDGQQSNNQVRAETFLLAPEIGLRGRLDVFWQQSGRQRLLELKTGGASGTLPKTDHRWQVQGYHALLTVRRDSTMKKAMATLLYSGTPGEAQAFGIPFTVKELHRVIETRNTLVLSHITGVPPAPPGPSRCTKCSMLHQCQQISALLDWQAPEPAIGIQPEGKTTPQSNGNHAAQPVTDNSQQPISLYTAEDREFFAKYYALLRLERQASEQQQALLWQETVEERTQRGASIRDLKPLGPPEPTGQGEWLQTFGCENTSELREGEAILLSDGDPITGAVVTGTIVRISSTQLTVWTPELIAQPALIDAYSSDIVHTRTIHNLLRWLHADPHLRALVAGKARPCFTAVSITPRADFNDEQNLAVERAVQMQDYLLVHGPPGTGKTSVIAEIVKQLTGQGQRVLLAAFTNQAVDNMLMRLDRESFHNYVRLGYDRSVHANVQAHLLKQLMAEQLHDENQHQHIRQLLRTIPVVASTTATWSSEKYAPSVRDSHTEEALFQFDVAIIDEASQLTIPAILGALRFAKRFILVGDEKQLPPLVLSKETAEPGLSDSLFSFLKTLDEGYMKVHPQEQAACVALRTQYRMNQWISHFASRVFYEGALLADPTVAKRVLETHVGAQFIAPNTGPNIALEAAWLTQTLLPQYPLVFVNVASENEHDGPKISNAEARAVRSVVQGLLKRGIVESDIGIIAPYRAQVANIRRHLFSDNEQTGWHALSSDTSMSVDTVDRFQGGERSVIIISFATTQTPDATNPLRNFLTNPNRLNVALTRAQRKLVVIGHASALEHLPYFERLLAYCGSMKTVIEAIQSNNS
ncbi:MAG TPA: AAA domain-containing protein [Ktedonobacteraceae bacterium]|nr:AAA domain-containing protein [Ktedonobacteraceae bacterium]